MKGSFVHVLRGVDGKYRSQYVSNYCVITNPQPFDDAETAYEKAQKWSKTADVPLIRPTKL